MKGMSASDYVDDTGPNARFDGNGRNSLAIDSNNNLYMVFNGYSFIYSTIICPKFQLGI